MSTGRIDWSETGLRIEDTENLTKDQVNLLLPDDITSWTSAEVAQWIRSLNPTFGPEAAIFDDEGIDGEMLLTLDDAIMKDELAIVSTLHRRKILSNILKKKEEWDQKYGAPPEPVVVEKEEEEEPTPKKKGKKGKREPTSKKGKSSRSSKASTKSKAKSKSKSSATSRSSKTRKSGKSSSRGGGTKLEDATIDEDRLLEFWKFCGLKKKDWRDNRVIFRYLDRKNKKQISGKDFRKAMIRFIPSKTEEKLRLKFLKLVPENKLQRKWKEFVESESGANGGADDAASEAEEDSEEPEEDVKTVQQDPNYDPFYDEPYIDNIDPYQLQLDVDRQATIIIAQKNRIIELEERVQKQMDINEMEVRQLGDKHREELKEAEKHMEKQLQLLREQHLQELGGVRDRAKNLKDLHKQTQISSTSIDGLEEQIQINNQLRKEIRDLQKELSTAKAFLETSAEDSDIEQVRSQLLTAVDMIAEKERDIVQLTKEKDDLMNMCKNLTMQLVSGSSAGAPPGTMMSQQAIDVTKTNEKLRQLQLSPSQAEIRSREEITAALEKAARRESIKPKRKVRHVRGESIDQFRHRLSLLVASNGGSDDGTSPTGSFDPAALLASDELAGASFLRDD